MTIINSISIYHWDQFKHKILQQHLRSYIIPNNQINHNYSWKILWKQKIENSLHHIGRRCFPRMNSGWNEDYLFLIWELPSSWVFFLIREKQFIFITDIGLFGYSVIGWYGYQVYISSFWRLNQHFFLKIYILISLSLHLQII